MLNKISPCCLLWVFPAVPLSPAHQASLLSVVLRHMHSSHRLLITGTPLQNNLHELWALLNYLLPHVFDDGESFDSWFSLKEGHAETSVVMQLHKVGTLFLPLPVGLMWCMTNAFPFLFQKCVANVIVSFSSLLWAYMYVIRTMCVCM